MADVEPDAITVAPQGSSPGTSAGAGSVTPPNRGPRVGFVVPVVVLGGAVVLLVVASVRADDRRDVQALQGAALACFVSLVAVVVARRQFRRELDRQLAAQRSALERELAEEQRSYQHDLLVAEQQRERSRRDLLDSLVAAADAYVRAADEYGGAGAAVEAARQRMLDAAVVERSAAAAAYQELLSRQDSARSSYVDAAAAAAGVSRVATSYFAADDPRRTAASALLVAASRRPVAAPTADVRAALGQIHAGLVAVSAAHGHSSGAAPARSGVGDDLATGRGS